MSQHEAPMPGQDTSCEASEHRHAPISAEEADVLHELGYSILGPLLAGFSLWLLGRHETRTPRSKLLFLSRDGYHLMRAFRKVCESRGQNVDTEYLYVPRISVAMANFEATQEGVESLLRTLLFSQDHGTIRRYCEFLMISAPSSDELSSHGLPDADEVLSAQRLVENDGAIETQLKAFMCSRMPEIEDRAVRERSAYMRYLASIGALDHSLLCAVDCGWFGSTLDPLSKILSANDNEAQIHGYFIGANSPKLRSPNVLLEGYLFHNHGDDTPSREIIETARLVELFLKTDQPPFFCFERRSDDTLCRVDGPAPAREHGIAIIQEAAFRYLDDWMMSKEDVESKLNAADIRAALNRLLENPTPAEARALGRRHYSVDAFSDESQSHFALPKLTLWQMLTNPDLRKREVGRSGSKRMYLQLCDSRAKRFLADITPVDYRPATRVHAAVRTARHWLSARFNA